MRQAPSDRAELIRLGAWVVLLLSAVFLLTTGGTYPGIASVEGHVIGQVVAYVVLGGWSLVAIRRPDWRPRTPLLLPILAACVTYALSAVFSQRPRLSFEPTIAGIGWAFGFLFLSRLLARTWFRVRVGVLLTAFVAVVAFGYLVQVAIEWWNWWGIIGRFALPPLRPSFAALFLGSPNLIATALIIAAPLVVAIAWSQPRRSWIAATLAVAAALATFVSGSRGAYLGIGLGVIVAVGLFTMRHGGPRAMAAWLADRFRARRVLLVPVIAVAALGAAFLPAVLNRFAQGGESLRFDLWRSATTIFAEHPILGGGPGTWVQLKVAANPPGVPNLILPHAHDMYIQAAAELGIVGLLGGALLALALLRRVWAGWRSTDASVSTEAGAVLVSLAAFAGQSVVDNLSNLPFVILLLVILVAWVDGRLAEAEGVGAAASKSPRRWAKRLQGSPVIVGAGLIAILALVPTLIRIDLAAIRAQEGDQQALLGNWQRAAFAYDAARELDPGFTLYELQTASAYSRLGNVVEARRILEAAVAADPVAVNLIGLAALEDDEGIQADYVQAAIALGYGEPVVALNAGLIAESTDRAMAIDQFANAIAWDPPLAGSDIWASPGRVEWKGDIVTAARARTNPLDAALILAYSGDPAGARTQLEAMSASPTRDTYLAAVIGIGGDAAVALSRFGEILSANPNDWFAAAMAARIARRAGADAEFFRYSSWAIAVQGDAAPGAIAEATLVPPPWTDSSASLPLNYPWSTYLRPISPSVVMPDLPVIRNR